MMHDPGKKPPMTTEMKPQHQQEDIRLRAYELYEARGREDGHALEDWLRAEVEIEHIQARRVAA